MSTNNVIKLSDGTHFVDKNKGNHENLLNSSFSKNINSNDNFSNGKIFRQSP